MLRSGVSLQRPAIRGCSKPPWTGGDGSRCARAGVLDLQVWELAPAYPILTARVLVAKNSDCHAIRRTLDQLLKERLQMEHTTLQVDHAPATLIAIQRQGRPCAPS
jgi:hypothetical protein